MDLQEIQQGETPEAYAAYLEFRLYPNITMREFRKHYYTGNNTLGTLRNWSATYKWQERVLDFNRPTTERIAEIVQNERQQNALNAVRGLTKGVTKIQEVSLHHLETTELEDEQAIDLQRHATKMFLSSADLLQKAYGIDFAGIRDTHDSAHESHVIGQIYDIIEEKLPIGWRQERLILPLQNLKSFQGKTAIQFLKSMDKEILCAGPVNTSKTMTILLYMLALHCAIPNFQSMLLMQEAKRIYITILPQLFNKLFALSPKDPRQPFSLYGGEKRPFEIHWDNGGTTYFGGFDNSEKIRGSEVDFIFIPQLERIDDESAYMELFGRLAGGRAGNWICPDNPKVPFNQVIGDANPDSPYHWLKQRQQQGRLTFFEFEHQDNPALYYNFDWTPQGIETVAELKHRYTGYMLDRMVYGLWKGAAGRVYPNFNENTHVKALKIEDVPKNWLWYIANDYGGQAPFCYQLWAVSPQLDTFWMMREIYHTGWTLDEQLQMLKTQLIHDVDINAMIAEHTFEHNERFRKEGIHIVLADKKKLDGIQLVNYWLDQPDALVFNKHALVHPPDPALLTDCTCTIEEFSAYSYAVDRAKTGTYKDEEPIKKHDHGMDALRYLLKTLDASRNYIPDFNMISYHVKTKPTRIY